MNEATLQEIEGGRSRRAAAPDPEVVFELERVLVSALLLDPSRLVSALAFVSPEDFSGAFLRAVLRTMTELHRSGRPVTVPAIADDP